MVLRKSAKSATAPWPAFLLMSVFRQNPRIPSEPIDSALRKEHVMRISLFTRAAAGVALVAALVAIPSEAAVVVPYVMDPTFNGGSYYVDAFASTPVADYAAKRLVRLDDGDVVVAGTVPDLRGGNVGALG